MIVIFVGINGLALLDFIPSGQSLTSDYDINNILKQFEINTNAYDVKKIKKVVYLHFNNALSHSSKAVKQYLDSSPFAKLLHPPYSPDLSLCDFAINGILKDSLEGCSFNSEEELFSAIKYFQVQKPSQFWENIFKVIDSHGNYFE